MFDNIWTASAFKGAHGETLVVPDIKRHLTNNLNWLALMQAEEPRLRGQFKGINWIFSWISISTSSLPHLIFVSKLTLDLSAGIVLTGWSRYDHFAVLCELLPAAVPSLAVALLATSHGYWNSSLAPPLYKALSCGGRGRTETEIDLDYDNFLWEKLSWCHFPGEKFFKVTKELVALEGEVAEFFAKVDTKRGWMTPYNVRHNMSSPFRIEDVSRMYTQQFDLTGAVEVLEDWSRTQHAVVSLMRTAAAALSEVYDQFTVAEWVEQKLYPFYSRLSQLRQQADTMRGVHSWPARPYPPLQVTFPATAFAQYYI